MLKTVLWIAGACAAVLVALAVSRNLHLDQAPPAASEAKLEVKAPPPAPAAAAPPPVAAVPPPPPAPPPPTAAERQVQDDAAATGMTTVEPEAPPT